MAAKKKKTICIIFLHMLLLIYLKHAWRKGRRLYLILFDLENHRARKLVYAITKNFPFNESNYYI